MKKIIYLIIAIFTISALSAQPFYNKSDWEKFFNNRLSELDPIEGIWSLSRASKGYNSNQELINSNNDFNYVQSIAIYKKDNDYIFYDLDDENYEEIKFTKTANQNIFICEYFYSKGLRNIVRSTAIMTNNMLLEYTYKEPSTEAKYRANKSNGYWPNGYYTVYSIKCLKIFPTENSIINKSKSSGTGFSISSNGIIVTNYHVIDGANTIKVRGINSNFNNTYKAKVLVSDKNNDLALIQIDDYNFKSLGVIPYTIKTSLSGVGENIFVLGYPLRATMGEEIKLTNGIISSKSGFQGEINSYQISAPIQPGNSGGPLFDSQGNIVGIINAKLVGAENASYAIKSGYLTNLIDLLPTSPKLQTINLLKGKTLTQQVGQVKNFVYIIETE